MTLLFDHNLPPQLVRRLADIFPHSQHVMSCGLAQAFDLDVWRYAQGQGLMIVTKDADFNDLILMRGFPPKVIWLRMGNCSIDQLEYCLRINYAIIAAFRTDSRAGILTLR